MSRKHEARAPGRSKVRKDTVRRIAAEAQWETASKPKRRLRKLADRIGDYARENFGAKRPEGIVNDLLHLADLYGDKQLRLTAARLIQYGLNGKDWKQTAKAQQGMWADVEEANAVLAVEEALDADLDPQEAYERAATAIAAQSQSHAGALQFVKRSYLKWEGTSPQERAPVMFMDLAPDPDASAGKLSTERFIKGADAGRKMQKRMRGK